jgi:hypothetical protein
VPPIDTQGHDLGTDGPSGRWWYCDGQNIGSLTGLPAGCTHHQTTTMYFNAGFGFWVSRGDATQTEANWHPLNFDHGDDYSSYVTNAGTKGCLACMRPDQSWPEMLFPDVYHGIEVPYESYGGLRGDISILWALIAFSLRSGRVLEYIPKMFKDGAWKTHKHRPTRRYSILPWHCQLS